MDPAFIIFVWAGLQVYFLWRFIERRRTPRDVRRRKRAIRERHISNQARIALMNVHSNPAPTLQERFDKAFYQAWIEPTLEIIAKIDAECTPESLPEPEQEPYIDAAECACVPCESNFETDEFIRLNTEITLRNQRIHALEARLKEIVDSSIQQNLMYGSAIDTKRIWR